MLHRLLSSKKLRLILLAFASIGFLVAAVCFIWSITTAAVFCAISFALLGGALICREYSVNQLQAKIHELDNSLSSIRYHTQPIHNIAGSVGRLRENNERIESILGSLQVSDGSAMQVGGLKDSDDFKRSYFAPGRIASISTPVLDGSIAGRIAATMESAESSSLNLTEVTEGSFDFFRRCAIVGPSSLRQSLAELCETRIIFPGKASGPSGEPESYLIIDERSNLSGPWSGVLTTQGTDLFQELYKIIESFKKRGTFVIVIPAAQTYHFTSTLRDTAHFVVGDVRLREKFGPDFSIPVLDVLSPTAKEAKK